MDTDLTFLSFGNTAASVALRGCLEGLGYSVRAIDGTYWLKGSGQNSQLTVALFGPDPLHKDLMPSLASRLNLENLLAVIAGQSAVDPGLLSLSAELAFWPCQDHELNHRLKRLSQRCQTKKHTCVTPGLDEFRRLNLIGDSLAFRSVLTRVQRISHCDAAVLLQGDTGTGKEILARAIHYLGDRQDSAFVPVNCGAIPPGLFESEFFGHVRGAFTDARQTHTGLVELAHKGTLFLDEVDSLSPQGQVSLLRFLQNQEFRPLGARQFKQVDVRIVAAGNRPLKELVRQGQFREDLFYRLNLFTVELPPLRQREDDSVKLANHFLGQFSRRYGLGQLSLTAEALAWLRHYDWPGNVRELENALHRACLLVRGREITLSDLAGDTVDGSKSMDNGAPVTESFAHAKQYAVDCFERKYLENLLQKTRGNVSEAARAAGKERRALGKLLKKHGLCREDFA